MQPTSKQNQLHGPLVFFVIWAALCTGVVAYQLTIGHGIPSGKDAIGDPTPPIVFVSGVVLIFASLVRWILIPRVKRRGPLLALFVIGLALSEAVTFFEIFLVPPSYPSTKLTLWLLSLASCIQFFPIYALKQASERPEHDLSE